MPRTLAVTLSRDRHGAPLATLSGLPGDDAAFTPAELRALARALEQIASDCEAPAGKRFVPKRKSYEVGPRSGSTCA